jgi:hypothetical protein
MANKDITKSSSCINKEPFVDLDPNGKASILNYNLPQATCYRVISNIVLELPESIFGTINPPRDNFGELAEKLTREALGLVYVCGNSSACYHNKITIK